MKKVKLQVSHSILQVYGEQLQILIANIVPQNNAEKILHILWVKCWLEIQKKGAFEFQGEKKISFPAEQGIALMEGIKRMLPPGEYEKAMFLKHIGNIDQQTA